MEDLNKKPFSLSVWLSEANLDCENPEKEAYVESAELSYDDCREELTSLFGEPTFENEEPYVASLGGCVMTCEFENGEFIIKLETASERDFIYLLIKNKDD